MIGDQLRKLAGYVVMGLSVIAGLILLFLSGKRKGELETELKNQKENAEHEREETAKEQKRTVEVVENKASVASDVARTSDADVDKRLRDQWSD